MSYTSDLSKTEPEELRKSTVAEHDEKKNGKQKKKKATTCVRHAE